MSCDMGPAKGCGSSKLKVDGDMRLLASFRVHKEGVPLGDNTVEKESTLLGRTAVGSHQTGSTHVGRWMIWEWKDLKGYLGTSVHLQGGAVV